MNDELQKQLAAMIATLTATVQEGGTWAARQIPPLVQEKIAFGRAWESSFFLILAVAAGWLCVVTFRAWGRAARDDYDFDTTMPAVVITLPAALLFAGSLAQLRDVFLVWFAPRLYIVEWLLDQVKK